MFILVLELFYNIYSVSLNVVFILNYIAAIIFILFLLFFLLWFSWTPLYALWNVYVVLQYYCSRLAFLLTVMSKALSGAVLWISFSICKCTFIFYFSAMEEVFGVLCLYCNINWWFFLLFFFYTGLMIESFSSCTLIWCKIWKYLFTCSIHFNKWTKGQSGRDEGKKNSYLCILKLGPVYQDQPYMLNH